MAKQAFLINYGLLICTYFIYEIFAFDAFYLQLIEFLDKNLIAVFKLDLAVLFLHLGLVYAIFKIEQWNSNLVFLVSLKLLFFYFAIFFILQTFSVSPKFWSIAIALFLSTCFELSFHIYLVEFIKGHNLPVSFYLQLVHLIVKTGKIIFHHVFGLPIFINISFSSFQMASWFLYLILIMFQVLLFILLSLNYVFDKHKNKLEDTESETELKKEKDYSYKNYCGFKLGFFLFTISFIMAGAWTFSNHLLVSLLISTGSEMRRLIYENSSILGALSSIFLTLKLKSHSVIIIDLVLIILGFCFFNTIPANDGFSLKDFSYFFLGYSFPNVFVMLIVFVEERMKSFKKILISIFITKHLLLIQPFELFSDQIFSFGFIFLLFVGLVLLENFRPMNWFKSNTKPIREVIPNIRII